MKIQELLYTKRHVVLSATPDMTLVEAARAMRTHKVGFMPVCDPAGKVVGVLSERDIVTAVADNGGAAVESRVSDVMPRRVFSCGVANTMEEAMEIMSEQGIRHLLVLDDGALIDVISSRDVIQYFAKHANTGEKAALWSKMAWL